MEGHQKRVCLAWTAALGAASAVCAALVDRPAAASLALLSQMPAAYTFVEVVIQFGKAGTLALLSLAALLCGRLRRIPAAREAAVRALAALALSGVLAQALKFAVRRPRPYIPAHLVGDHSTGYYRSFPSADAAAAFAFAFAFSAVFPRSRPWLVIAASAVCVGRVLRLAHYPSDVLAGAAAGVAGYAAAEWALGLMRRRSGK